MKVLLFLVCMVPMWLHSQTMRSNIENTTPASRYIVNMDGTVTDQVTGLMWVQCSEGQSWELKEGEVSCVGVASEYTWDIALSLAKTKVFAGYSDWRLPNIKELASLISEDRYDPAINIVIFPQTSTFPGFWSGTPYLIGSGRSTQIVYFTDGYIESRGDRAIDHNVRLVRNIP